MWYAHYLWLLWWFHQCMQISKFNQILHFNHIGLSYIYYISKVCFKNVARRLIKKEIWAQLIIACETPWFLKNIYFFIYFSFIFISWRLITLQYCSGFCHTLAWISHGVTCIPHPNPPFHLPLHPIPLGLPSAPGLSTCLMHPAWAGDLFHYRQYTCFDAVLLKTSHPRLLPQSPKVCSIHLCLFFCFAYRVIITIFLNSIYMR